MEPKVIKWDGSHVPEELRSLPPGRYAEEAGILAGLEELDAGRGIPLADVIRDIRAGLPKR